MGKASGDTDNVKTTLVIRLDRLGDDRGQFCSGQSCLELFRDRLLNLKGKRKFGHTSIGNFYHSTALIQYKKRKTFKV